MTASFVAHAPPRASFSMLTFVLAGLGCGPGGFASDGSSGFGSEGDTSSADGASATSTDGGPEPGETDGGSESGGTDEGPEPGETEAGEEPWVDPDLGSEGETGEPEPIDPLCQRVWTHVDGIENHGHIGATPLGGRPDGGFVSITPLIGVGNDIGDVDAWFRSWTPSGELEWERQVSWGDLRDDPLVLTHDALGDLFTAGRLSANTMLENAMVAALDGASGELIWTFERGIAGGYGSLAHNGVALVAAGLIGDLDEQALELVAFDMDTGQQLWLAAPQTEHVISKVRGVVMHAGRIDLLATGWADDAQHLLILRFEPPDTQPEVLASLASDGFGVAPQDLERLDDGRLAALFSAPSPSLSLVDAETGELQASVALDELGFGTGLGATELAVTPGGLALAGTHGGGIQGERSFVMQLDSELEPICFAELGMDDLEGVFHSLPLRGMVAGPAGELVTASFVEQQRLSVFARWQ
jgi:hypothetical protein